LGGEAIMNNSMSRMSFLVWLTFATSTLGCGSKNGGSDEGALENGGAGSPPMGGRAGIVLAGGMAGVALSGAGGQGGTAGKGTSSGGAGTGGSATGGAGTGMAGMGPACTTGTLDCNGSCIGPGDSGGGCTLLSLAGDRATIDHGLSLDDGYVYWAEQSGRVAVARIAKTGGTREDLVITEDIPYSPSPSSDRVFFSTSGFSESALSVIPKAGGEATVLATNSDGIPNVAANDSRVYYSREHFLDSGFEIVSLTVDGKDEIVHAKTASFRDPGLLLDSTHVYFLNSDFFDPSALQRTTLDGTTVETITSFGDISNFALAGESIVFYDTDSKSLYTVPNAGGTPMVLYKPIAVEPPLSLAANARFAYWTTGNGIWRVGLDGTGATELLHTTNTVELIAVDASGLYASVDTASYTAPAFVVKIAEPN
jgi:hypothetical protein